MAEIEKTNSVNAGEMAQRFAHFVLMHTQQIMFVLGAPSPEGDSMPPNLEGGRMLIDQLEMIQQKTKGNLSSQEAALLEDALTRVRLIFVQVAGEGTSAEKSPSRQERPPAEEPASNVPRAATEASPSSTKKETPDEENKKKFTKSYG